MAIALSIIFLNTAKTDVGGSLLTLGIAIVLSLAAALHERAHEGLAD